MHVPGTCKARIRKYACSCGLLSSVTSHQGARPYSQNVMTDSVDECASIRNPMSAELVRVAVTGMLTA